MISIKNKGYDSACESILHIIPALENVPEYIKANATEIRLKSGQAVIIRSINENYTLQTMITPKILEECISAFCRYSVHNYENDISNGFVTLKGGHRAGFSGNAVYTNGKVSYIKDVSSVNIRIARQHFGCAGSIAELFFSEERPDGILIVGKPLSGKTTILRDLCRSIGQCFRLSVIDERNEICACFNGVPQLDTGILTDVFSCFSKNDGIERAIRTMSPQYIVLDESGFDVSLSDYCFNSGVGIIMTAHADGVDDIMKNCTLCKILESGSISHLAVLSSITPGQIDSIKSVKLLTERMCS